MTDLFPRRSKRPKDHDEQINRIAAAFPRGARFFAQDANRIIGKQASPYLTYEAQRCSDCPEGDQLRRPAGARRGWVFVAGDHS